MKKSILLFNTIFINLIAQDEIPKLNHFSSSLNVNVIGEVISPNGNTNEGKIITNDEPSIIITDKNGKEISVLRFEKDFIPTLNNLNFDVYTKAVWLNNSNYKEKTNFNFDNNVVPLSHTDNSKHTLTTILSILPHSFHKDKGVLNKVNGSINGNSVPGLYTAPFSNLNITYIKSGNKIGQ